MRIDRCLCYGATFRSLKEIAERTGARSLDELRRHVEFGTNCGLCRPYVRRMLETGQTVFSEIIDAGSGAERK